MINRFYPIVPDVTWLTRLVPLGVKTIQLRLKDASPEDIKNQITKSIALCKAHDCQLIVNDYWREAIELGADYIHLGQEDLQSADLYAIRKANIKFGLSSHDHQELQTAIDAQPDYIALGPIYETKLKKMKWAPQGLERVKEWKSIIAQKLPKCPLVAIGGITPERAPFLFQNGADSVAIVTDIITSSHPEQRVLDWGARIKTM